jgi:hypothetical protein
MKRNGTLGMLALVLFVIVPLGMAPRPKPEKIQAGPIKTHGRTCISPLCGGFVLEERDGSDNLVRQIAYGGDGPMWQLLSDGSSQYYHEDPRGNIVMLTEDDPYGKPLIQDAANQNKTDPLGTFLAQSDFANTLLFGGTWYDPETGARGSSLNSDFGGFYLAGGRHSNPDEGRYGTRYGTAGDPDRPVITGQVYHTTSDPGFGIVKGGLHSTNPSGSQYGFAGSAPANTSGLMQLELQDAMNKQHSTSSGGEGEIIITGGDASAKIELEKVRITSYSFSGGGEGEIIITGGHAGPAKSTPSILKACNKGEHLPGADGSLVIVYGHGDPDAQTTGELYYDPLIDSGHESDTSARHRMFAIIDRSIPRSGGDDDKSSCWIRVSQPHAGKVVLKGKKILQN